MVWTLSAACSTAEPKGCGVFSSTLGGHGAPESSAEWVPSHMQQLAPVQARNTGNNVAGQASRWRGVGESASVTSSAVHEFLGPQAVRWKSPRARRMLWRGPSNLLDSLSR